MTSEEKLSFLIDRPCSACKFHKDNGCSKWNCVFEEKTESFDSVIEDIKAEIAEEICLTDNPYTKQTEYTISHKKLLEIIDKHISGKESE